MIEKIVIVSLAITGLFLTMQEGMIFFFIRREADEVLLHSKFSLLRKPLYDCLVCMASIWGITLYLIPESPVKQFIVSIFAICGTLGIICKLTNCFR